MNKNLCIILKKGLFFVLILTLFSCNMNSKTNYKNTKINNVNFSINKKSEVITLSTYDKNSLSKIKAKLLNYAS